MDERETERLECKLKDEKEERELTLMNRVKREKGREEQVKK